MNSKEAKHVNTWVYSLVLMFMLGVNILSNNVIAQDGTTTDAPASSPVEEPGPSCTGGEGSCSTDSTTPPTGNLPNSGVGNPINLMSGNKHQSETDFDISGAMLTLRRTYNSADSDSNRGLGQGWNHTFAVSLSNAGNDSLQIIGGDGRRIQFFSSGTNDEGYPLYRATQSNNGYLSFEGDRHRWHLSDGRILSFNGSYLVNINWPDQRELKLYYRYRRLHSVTDETGRVLRFNYTAGTASTLRSFEATRFTSVEGYLASVTLPDGSEIGYDYDDKRNLTRARFPDGTSREYHYEDEIWPNRLTGLTDRTGVRFATWSYDDQGRAVSSEHANGVEKVTLQYPDLRAVDRGDVVETVITNSLGGQSVYTWQKRAGLNRELLLSSSGAGCVTCPVTGMEYTYDEQGRLLQAHTTREGTATTKDTLDYEYDEAGRLSLIERVDVAGSIHLVVRYEYAANDLQPLRTFTPSINPQSERVTEIEKTANKRPIRIIERGYAPEISLINNTNAQPLIDQIIGYRSIERITSLEYNDQLQLTAIDGPRTDVNDVITLRYDGRSQLASIETPLSPTLRFLSYDALGRLTRFQLGTQKEVILTRDDQGQVITSSQGERVNTFTYDKNGKMTSVSDTDGRTTSMRFDEAGRLEAVTDDLGRVQQLEHDTEGRVTSRSSLAMDGTLIQSLETLFDLQGVPSQVSRKQSDNQGHLSTSSVDISSLDDGQSQITDYSDTTSGLSSQVKVDYLTRIAQLIGSEGTNTQAQLDVHGQIVRVTDPRNNTTAYLRDDFGNIIVQHSVDTGTLLMQYDTAGNLIQTQNQTNQISKFEYDEANRLIQRIDADGITRWEWDPASGGLASVVNEQGADKFTYNTSGLLESHSRLIDQHRFETRYRYDERERLTQTRLPDGQLLQHHYHESGVNRGQLASITRGVWGGLSQQTLVDQIDQDARDGTTGYISGAGVGTDYNYSANGNIQSIEIGQSLRLDYRVDAIGRVVGIEENGLSQHYGYRDGALVIADTLEGILNYSYDAAGNRTRKRFWQNQQLLDDEQYRYPEAGEGNRLLERIDALTGQSKQYAYNSAGSPVTQGEISYDYDSKQQPVALYRNGELLARYSYNGFGERIKKVVYGSSRQRPKVTYYLYSGSTLVAEVNETGTPTAQYVYLNNHRPVLKLHADEAFVIHTDHLGTPRMMSDMEGSIRWQARYTPFGEAVISREEIELPLRFPGQYADAESETHYNYLRDYDPDTGRYLRSDPIGLGGGINTYAYVSSNPLGAMDPLGLRENTLLNLETASDEVIDFLDRNGLRGPAQLTTQTANQPIPPPTPGVTATRVLSVAARAAAVVSLALASYEVGYAAAWLADNLFFAPDDQAELVNQIKRYDPDYEISGVAAQLDREGIRALGDVLRQTQLNFLTVNANSCTPGFETTQLWFDANWAVYGDGYLAIGSTDPVAQQVQREGVLFPSEAAYRAERANYEASGAEEAGLSFGEWWGSYGLTKTTIGPGDTISGSREAALAAALEANGLPAGAEPDEIVYPGTMRGAQEGLIYGDNIVLYLYLRDDGTTVYIREDAPVNYPDGPIGDQTSHFNSGTVPGQLPSHHYWPPTP